MLLWFRRDLRLTDNPALNWDGQTGRPVVPVFILDDDQPGTRPPGGAEPWTIRTEQEAPYRVFTPFWRRCLQERFDDPEARYLRQWLPELRRLPNDLLHAPWEAPAAALDTAGVRPGTDYPHPMVDHAAARERALEAYRRLVNVPTRI